MDVPVLREKQIGVIWMLTYACVIEWPLRAVCPSLGRLRGLLCTFSSLQAFKVVTRELKLLEYMAILEREASAQICEGLTCASCVAVISGSYISSIVSLVTKNYRWGDSGSIMAQTWPQERSQNA